MFLAIDTAILTSGTAIQNKCDPGLRWRLDNNGLIINKQNKCLAVRSNRDIIGNKIVETDCKPADKGQSWRVDGTFLVNGFGKCLSVNNNAETDRMLLVQWTCLRNGENHKGQAWYPEDRFDSLQCSTLGGGGGGGGGGAAGQGTGTVVNNQAQGTGVGIANAGPGGFGVGLGLGIAITTPFGNYVVGKGMSQSM